LHKKQKLEPVDNLRLNAWGYEDLENQAQRDVNIGHEGKVASLDATHAGHVICYCS
jgi:hypothetical protein